MSSRSRRTSQSVALTRLAQISALALAATLVGCQSTRQHDESDSVRASYQARVKHKPAPLLVKPVEQAPQDVWERMRQGFALQDDIGVNPRIEQQRLWFASNPTFLESAGERGSLYLHYIVERLEERDMPLELALLPAIESAYNPMAYSRAHAVGLWQFIPSTGRHFKLRQTNFYDGRRDITASTNAALDYLSRLHDMFNGDWLLALAAYNAGEGTVSRAIERNERLGLPTDYWNLPLPQETRDYVPKLLALSQVVLTPDAYGVNLNPIANEPYFEAVAINERLDLSRVAAFADIDEDELIQLNPAFKKRMTVDGPKQLLVPTAKAQLLSDSLSNLKPEELVSLQPNKAVFQAALAEAKAPVKARSYRVKRGDNLSSIAKAHRVSVRDLQRWNRLSGNRVKAGQVLALRGGSSSGAANRVASSKQRSTQYKVRKGDSLYAVAKRFNVEMKHLKRWNPRSGHALKPGQTLTVYLSH
ncbi:MULTISPECIES: lytic transglycosylase domain-containing protein [Pseudomonas]|uniref:lytic transglycosylase domain-containing protein n=1 Tax=Pseudomonas TaxID=286 RepID=UPI0018A9310B|nr:lytic transglycosylase domain-containing protein [Pseudomonas guariconensis]MBF8723005.1 transglycosylase SLT domain-containing protein [Pseudomonas guariconensis]MBF8740911.1 transglycosylase SLT domain-containing protein [Pseudomonas guariconensis]MBF8750505.1 transglycosylase SLT domain-containing protein [Pseudomonas guariconensis]MBF8793511.1 transglycosylase SLT domain-containing protein [Pseudomonas monteilii]